MLRNPGITAPRRTHATDVVGGVAGWFLRPVRVLGDEYLGAAVVVVLYCAHWIDPLRRPVCSPVGRVAGSPDPAQGNTSATVPSCADQVTAEHANASPTSGPASASVLKAAEPSAGRTAYGRRRPACSWAAGSAIHRDAIETEPTQPNENRHAPLHSSVIANVGHWWMQMAASVAVNR